jgi:hypothetical protein
MIETKVARSPYELVNNEIVDKMEDYFKEEAIVDI